MEKLKQKDKLVTIGIPAYHATKHICDLLASIQIQKMVEVVSVIISPDDPKDNYDFVLKRFPNLDITILKCDKNGGPGIARQRAFNACKTPWITFCDADDLLYPFAIQSLLMGVTDQNVIEVQGIFYQECDPNPQNIRLIPRNDIGHPWVFGRLYNVAFLKNNKIGFTELRAMEDGEMNWKIRLTIEGTPLRINVIEDPIYIWRTGSEHSITRIGIEENGGEPLYNWNLCQVGATAASINAIKFCKKTNPFNGNITRFTVEMMIGQYFTYVECLEKKPLFAEQNLFNAKRFYNCCYKEIENQISKDVLKEMYTIQRAQKGNDLVGVVPQITLFDFMEKIKTEEYGGKVEFDKIREGLPDWVKKLDKKSGVLGDEGYVYVIDEK